VAAQTVTVEWVTVPEAAARLGMSPSWLRALADESSIEIHRRGARPGVNWNSVQAYIERCRITERINDSLLRQMDPERPVRGVALMDRIKARFGWSDHDVADALGVYPSAVSRYRFQGVPEYQIPALRKLERLSADEVVLPRRVRWERRERKTKKVASRGDDVLAP
jgi:hypothetical protein